MYDKVCLHCKSTLSDFYSTGMLGCPECYKAFSPEIELALKKIQGRVFHDGKKPKTSKLEKELISEYQRLIHEKEQASLDGRFSDMRRISEEILSLSEELRRRGII